MATDGRMLYLALRAKGHGTPRRYAGHDAPVWNNDALECFLTPDLESGEYTQFIADLLGQRYDSLNGDFHGFNPPWHAAAREEGGEWCIEAAIPLDAVASGLPGDGTVWKAGFFRLGRANAGWSATLGSHNSVRRHGLLVFGSLGAALDRQCAFLPADAANGSARMRQLAARVEALRAGEARRSPTAFASAMEQLPALRAELRKLRFAEHFASSKSPLVVQPAFPYEGSVSPSGEEVAAALEADFYEGEVRDFAFHLTNVGDRAVTIRASLFGVKPEQFRLDRRTIHHLLLGIPGFPATFYAPAEVASGDGTRVADALVPNPAGVWRIAPRETVQCFFRVHSPRKAQVSEGVLLFQAIDGTPLEAPPIPVRFRTRATGALGAASKPTTLGFDFLPHEVADTRPGFARRHYQMLRDFGFNMVILSGLRDLPRPRANRDGTLVGPLDFSRLRSRLALLGTNFDHYYLNVDVWEKRTQRKDLFGLDFYDPAYETAFKQWFKVCADELKRLGVPDARLVVCPLDEAVDERAETIARWIKEACPGIRLIADCSSPDLARVRSIDRYLDVWMPHVKTLRQEALEGFHQYLRQGGKPRLLYYYCTGSNEKRKKPHEDYIVRFHEVFARGFGGLAYWAAGQYYGDPWYRRPYAGAYDTALLYPAEAGPVPSRRLAAWHRGTQDLWLLRETAARYRSDAGVLRRLSVAAQGVADYPSDYRRAEELRQYCRTLLENRR